MRVLRQARSVRLVAMVVLALLAAGFSACSDILLLPGEEGDWCAEPKPGDDNPCGEGLISPKRGRCQNAASATVGRAPIAIFDGRDEKS